MQPTTHFATSYGAGTGPALPAPSSHRAAFPRQPLAKPDDMNILVSTAALALAILSLKASPAPNYIATETRLYMEVLPCQVLVFADTPAAQVVDCRCVPLLCPNPQRHPVLWCSWSAAAAAPYGSGLRSRRAIAVRLPRRRPDSVGGIEELLGLDIAAGMNLKKGNTTLADNELVQPTLVKKPHGGDVGKSEF